MKPIVIRRLPQASAALVVLALIAHIALCYPAATSRGYPPIHPFWETLAPLLVFTAVFLFSFFDDRREVRRSCLRVFVPLACVVQAVVTVNLMGPRPRPGRFLGMVGLFAHNMAEIFVLAIMATAIIYPVCCILDDWTSRQWPACRGFASPDTNAPLVRFSTRALLASVAVICCLLGFWLWARRTYFAWPRAEFSHRCNLNLKRIGMAMQEYYATYASFPPAYIADDGGKPVHSWRVLLLPFLGDREQDLYKRYRFDEPWNGTNNRWLSEQMPDVYRCAWNMDRESTETSYVVVVGPQTAFPGSNPRKSIPDGPWNTVLAVEFDHSGIHWMEPRDLEFDAIDFELKSPAPVYPRHEHFGERHYLLNAAFADGSRRSFDALSPDALRALITADGGEPTPLK